MTLARKMIAPEGTLGGCHCKLECLLDTIPSLIMALPATSVVNKRFIRVRGSTWALSVAQGLSQLRKPKTIGSYTTHPFRFHTVRNRFQSIYTEPRSDGDNGEGAKRRSYCSKDRTIFLLWSPWEDSRGYYSEPSCGGQKTVVDRQKFDVFNAGDLLRVFKICCSNSEALLGSLKISLGAPTRVSENLPRISRRYSKISEADLQNLPQQIPERQWQWLSCYVHNVFPGVPATCFQETLAKNPRRNRQWLFEVAATNLQGNIWSESLGLVISNFWFSSTIFLASSSSWIPSNSTWVSQVPSISFWRRGYPQRVLRAQINKLPEVSRASFRKAVFRGVSEEVTRRALAESF